jgi:hypothetical protein
MRKRKQGELHMPAVPPVTLIRAETLQYHGPVQCKKRAHEA